MMTTYPLNSILIYYPLVFDSFSKENAKVQNIEFFFLPYIMLGMYLFTTSYAMHVFVYYILIYCKLLAIDNGMLNFHQRFCWKIMWGF